MSNNAIGGGLFKQTRARYFLPSICEEFSSMDMASLYKDDHQIGTFQAGGMLWQINCHHGQMRKIEWSSHPFVRERIFCIWKGPRYKNNKIWILFAMSAYSFDELNSQVLEKKIK